MRNSPSFACRHAILAPLSTGYNPSPAADRDVLAQQGVDATNPDDAPEHR